MAFQKINNTLSRPDRPGTKAGPWIALCAVFGGMLVAYSAMIMIVFLIPSPIDHAMIVPFLFLPLAWTLAALWISVAPNRLNALLRGLIPSMVLAMGILFFLTRSQ